MSCRAFESPPPLSWSAVRFAPCGAHGSTDFPPGGSVGSVAYRAPIVVVTNERCNRLISIEGARRPCCRDPMAIASLWRRCRANVAFVASNSPASSISSARENSSTPSKSQDQHNPTRHRRATPSACRGESPVVNWPPYPFRSLAHAHQTVPLCGRRRAPTAAQRRRRHPRTISAASPSTMMTTAAYALARA